MKHLSLIFILLTSITLNAQFSQDRNFDYIKYMIDPAGDSVLGTGDPIAEARTIEFSYDEIIVGNGIQVFVQEGTNTNIKIAAQENILPLVLSENLDNKLVVRLSASLETDKGIKLYLPIGSLHKINVKEGAYLHIPKAVSATNLKLLIQSGSIADCYLNLEQFSCTVMGGSELHIEGKVTGKADIFVKGGSILKGKLFESAYADVIVLGASKCSLKVNDLLDARVENESKLVYHGNPKIGIKSTKLNGKIKRRFIK